MFAVPKDPAIVPDVMLNVGVEPPEDCLAKENRSYFIWNFGKPPGVVIEIVSNKIGGKTPRSSSSTLKSRCLTTLSTIPGSV